MNAPESGSLPPPLKLRIGPQAGAGEIARAFVADWCEIDAALSPIVGTRGVAALFKRSLFLATREHPGLKPVLQTAEGDVDLASLEQVLSRLDHADARVAGEGVLQTLRGLLFTLIGPALTAQLLRAAWTNAADETPPQDTPT